MQNRFRLHFITTVVALVMAGCGGNDDHLRQRATQIFEKAKDALARGDHQASRRLLTESVALDEVLGEKERRAEGLLSLGENYAAGAQFDTALMFYESARRISREVSDNQGVRAATLAIARVHATCDEFEHASAILVELLRLEDARRDTAAASELKWALIPVLHSLGDVGAEQRILNEQIRYYQAKNDLAHQAQAHVELGRSLLAHRNLPDALHQFVSSITCASRSGNALATITAMNFAAIVQDRMGDQAAAFQFFSDAIRLADTARGVVHVREEILLRVGNIYLRQKKFSEAKKFFNIALRSAIKTQNKMNESYALLQLAHCTGAEGNPEATKEYEAGAALTRHLGLPSANAYAQSCLAYDALRHGRLTDALELYRNAVASEDSSFAVRDENSLYVDCERAARGDADQSSPYNDLVDLQLQLGKTDEAFRNAEQRSLVNSLKTFGALTIHAHDASLDKAFSAFADARHHYIGTERQLAYASAYRSESIPLASELKQTLAQTAKRLRELGESLAATHERYEAAVILRQMNIINVQKLLSQGSALVDFIPTQKSLYVLVLTPQASAVRISAVEKPVLLSAMQEYANLLSQRTAELPPTASAHMDRRIRVLSTQLYSMLLLPIERDMQELNRLYVILPPGAPMIPLHALSKQELRPQYMIERLSIRYLPDASTLALKGTTANTSPSVVGFGNAGSTSWDVEYELSDTRTFSKDTRLYFGKEASLETLRREKADVLHMVADVRFFPQQPANSYVVLSEGKGYASVRYERIGELFGVPSFPIVMLSNLSTQPLHAIVPRIFHMNGTSDVVMNSFVPTRKAKKFFVGSFYTNLLAGNSAEASYRNALLEMIRNKEYASPHMWAAFGMW